MGPAQTDWYRLVSAAQGSMGIVTLASVRCKESSKVHKLFFITSEKLEGLLDFAYRVLKIRFGDEFLILNNFDLAAILSKNPGEIASLNEKLPKWSIILGIAGRSLLAQKRVEYQEADIRNIARQFGLKLKSSIAGAKDSDVMQAIMSPSKEPYWKQVYKGNCQDIFFITTLNRIPEFVNTVYSVADSLGYPRAEIGIYIQPMQQGVNCHCEFSLPYNPGNDKETSKALEFYKRASEELLHQGAFFSRPYGIWADMVYDRAAETTMMLKKLKSIFDPKNVLNPGKLCF
jgi:hypothetical protein